MRKQKPQKKKHSILLALTIIFVLVFASAGIAACGMYTFFPATVDYPTNTITDFMPENIPVNEQQKTQETISETSPELPSATPEPVPEILILSKRSDNVFTLNGAKLNLHAYEIEDQVFIDIFEFSAILSAAEVSTASMHFNPRWNENRDTLYIESESLYIPEETYEDHFIERNDFQQAVPVVVTVFLDENTINIPAYNISDDIFFALYELSYAFDLIIISDPLENKTDIFTNRAIADIISRRDRIDPSKPMVALTYDDGPGKLTDSFLDVLEKHGAVATFYVIGRQVNSYSETIQRSFDMGNEIANHTWSHVSLERASAGTIRKQINDTNNAIEAVTGVAPASIRPPFGAINTHARNVIKEFDMPVIMWAIDPSDYLPRSPYNIYRYIMDRVTDRDIILLHDIHERSLEATKTLIPSLISKGYQFVTVSELMYFSEITPEPGKTYRHTRP